MHERVETKKDTKKNWHCTLLCGALLLLSGGVAVSSGVENTTNDKDELHCTYYKVYKAEEKRCVDDEDKY